MQNRIRFRAGGGLSALERGALLWPLLLIVVVASAALLLSSLSGLPALPLALLLGLVCMPQSLYRPHAARLTRLAHGALRIGVALLGARVGAQDLAGLGWRNAGLISGVTLLSIAAGFVIARALRLRPGLALASACGVSICGASAVAATLAALPPGRVSARETAALLVAIPLLSTSAMLVYPLVLAGTGWSEITQGIFLGGSIHDMAQVVAAGYGISEQAGNTATLAKFVRIGWLLPVVLLAFWTLGRRGCGGRLPVPWFMAGFALVFATNTLGLLSPSVATAMAGTSQALLLIAMAAVGTGTTLAGLREVGWRPLFAMVLQSAVLALLLGTALAIVD